MLLKTILNLCFISNFWFAFHVQAAEFSTFESLKAEFVRRGFSGAVLVKKKAHILFQEAFGMVDLANNKPNTLETRFAVGSSTKQVTAAAILLLKERGLLSLDETLDQLLPEYDFPWAKKVNVHQLLTHSSGIFSYTSTPQFFAIVDELGKKAQVDDFVALFKDKPLGFEPGSAWSYSNSGYLLAGMIISKLSGQSYADFIHTEFFKKLGMTKTSYQPLSWSNDNALPLAFDRDYNLVSTPYRLMIWADAAGGVMTTVNDWSLWLDWLHTGGTLLSDESLALMKTAHFSIPSSNNSYGYGVLIGNMFGYEMHAHGGDMPGFHFMDLTFVKEDIQIIVATNQEPGSVRDQMTVALAALSIEGKGNLPDLRDDITVSNEILVSYEGKYNWTETAEDGTKSMLEAEIFSDNSMHEKRLYIRIQEQMELWLIPQSESVFAIKNIARVEFLDSGDMVLTQGREFHFVRSKP